MYFFTVRWFDMKATELDRSEEGKERIYEKKKVYYRKEKEGIKIKELQNKIPVTFLVWS